MLSNKLESENERTWTFYNTGYIGKLIFALKNYKECSIFALIKLEKSLKFLDSRGGCHSRETKLL